jgi:hypothetical protein
MTDQFTLDDIAIRPDSLDKPQMILLYGPPGNGKSYLAASASEVDGLWPVAILDTEGSTQGTIEDFDKSRIQIVRPQERYPGNEYKASVTLLENLLTKEHPYKTVIVDTADILQEWSIAEGRVPGDGYAHWNFTHSELTAPPVHTRGSKTDWLDRGLFHRLKAAPFLTILVVHDKQEALNEESTLMYANVQWQGQGKTKIGGIPDIVGYVTRDTNSAGVSTSTLYTAPTKRNLAKNRFGLPAKMFNPRMRDIYEFIANRNTTHERVT